MKKSFPVLTLKPFVPIQLQDSSSVLYKVNKTEKSPNTCDSAKLYFGLRFRCRSRRLCLNSLLGPFILEKKSEDASYFLPYKWPYCCFVAFSFIQ